MIVRKLWMVVKAEKQRQKAENGKKYSTYLYINYGTMFKKAEEHNTVRQQNVGMLKMTLSL